MSTRRSVTRLPWRTRYEWGPDATSWLRKIAVRATHRHCTVSFGDDVYAGPGFHLYIPHVGTLIVGDRVTFRRGFVCEISGEGRVEIGSDTVFTVNTLIQCTTSISIGEHCTFAQDVLIVDGSHRFRDPDVLMSRQGFDFRPITIGMGATVMAKSTVIADIGERAFVGAHSVVTRPVPPYSLAIGSPARVVETFGPPTGEGGGAGSG